MAILLLTATATLATPADLSSKLPANLNIFQAIFLGLVQGVTEFLPISSSAHLKVVPEALHWGDPGVAFTAIIQLGSIAAVIWFFWSDIVTVVTGAFTAIGNGPDNQALAALRVAGGEKAGCGAHEVLCFHVAACIQFAAILLHNAVGFWAGEAKCQNG